MTNQELKELVAALAVAHAKTSTRLDATTKLLTDYIAGQEASRARALLALGQSDYAFEASGAQVHAPLKQTVAAGDSVGNGLVVDLSVSPSKAAVAKAFFFSSLSANPVLDGILFNRIEFAEQIRFNNKQAEFGIVMVKGKSVAVIEVKYKVHEKDIEQVEKSLKAYRDFSPEHKDFDLYGGIAGFSISPAVTQSAKDKGYFVLKRKGDVFTTDAKSMRAY